VNHGECSMTATARPDGAMDVAITLKGVRAWHVGNGNFEIYKFIGKAPFAIDHLGNRMRVRVVLKMTSRLNMTKVKRALWSAVRYRGQGHQVLIDDGPNPKAVKHAY
jgi:hypothetical protein